MRLPSRQARAPADVAGGALTFSSVPSGIGTSLELLDHPRGEGRRLLEVLAAPAAPGAEVDARPWSACWETAIAGMPSTIPSSAAATVPE